MLEGQQYFDLDPGAALACPQPARQREPVHGVGQLWAIMEKFAGTADSE